VVYRTTRIQLPAWGNRWGSARAYEERMTTPKKKTPSSSQQQGNTYGLYELPANCRITHVNISGESTVKNLPVDDVIMLGSFIKMACAIAEKHDVPEVVILDNHQDFENLKLIEYILTVRYKPDTLFEIQHLALLENVDEFRCSGKDSIRWHYDKVHDKVAYILTIASKSMPVRCISKVLIHQHIERTLYTTNGDEMCSKNDSTEASIRRKRRKVHHSGNQIQYEVISDNTIDR
jgi:hypothetical protein